MNWKLFIWIISASAFLFVLYTMIVCGEPGVCV